MSAVKKNPRGFIILIILAVIATSSVILATQLSSVSGQNGAKIRTNEEVKARDVAEYCLEVADAYAVAVGNSQVDFDTLLDPNGVIEADGAGDDFLPPATLLSGATSIVAIPPAQTTSHFRFRAFAVSPSSGGDPIGTCFIRYDDNSDDDNSFPDSSVTGNTNGVAEGPSAPNNGADVAERDRDRTIITTVVGVVPARSDQSTAYVQAHARATVRRVRAMPSAVAGGAAIQAGGTVDFDGAICGRTAGLLADEVKGGVCVCGKLDAQLVSGSQGTTDGDCGCPKCAPSTGSTTTSGPRADPTIDVPAFGTLLSNKGFGTVTSDGSFTASNNIASATFGAAVVYLRNKVNAPAGSDGAAGTTDVFAWDRFDADTNATLTAGGAAVNGTGNATKDCTDTSGLDPIPDPCGWDLAGKALTCSTAQSQCWKLVARLGDGAAADIDITGTAVTEQADAAGTGFLARSGNLPNFKNTGANTARWRDVAPGTGSGGNDGPSCTSCTASAAFITTSGTDYAVSSSNTLADVPHMIIVIDSASASTTTVGSLSRTGSKISVFSNNNIEIAGSHQCCATCSCTQNCSSGTTMTATTNGPALAIRTDRDCADTSTFGIIGQIMCRELDLGNSNNNCSVGGLIGLGDPVTDPVTAGGGTLDCKLPGASKTNSICEDKANFCVKNNFDLVGDLSCAGNICMKNNLDMHGGVIQTLGSIGWKNNPVAAGQIRAGGDIVGKNNATITFDGNAGATENQGVAQAMWMDATW